MNILLTVLARKGSKGLPKKAMRLLCGKPLCEWTMMQAAKWRDSYHSKKRIIDLIVHTDSVDVAEVAVKYSGYLTLRSSDNANDNAGKLDAIREAAHQVYPENFDCIIDLDICNPLRTQKDIENAFQMWRVERPDTVVSVTPAYRNPHYNIIRPFGQEVKTVCQGGYKRRQDCPPAWDMNNSIFVYDREWLLKGGTSALTVNTRLYQMEEWQRVDIDTMVDLVQAEALMREYL